MEETEWRFMPSPEQTAERYIWMTIYSFTRSGEVLRGASEEDATRKATSEADRCTPINLASWKAGKNTNFINTTLLSKLTP